MYAGIRQHMGVWNLESSNKQEKQEKHIQGKAIREILPDLNCRIIMNTSSSSKLQCSGAGNG